MRRRATVAVMVVGALLPVARPAAGQTFDVKLPEVTKGQVEAGFDNTWHLGVPRSLGSDINRRVHEQSLDVGVTERWKLGLVAKLEKPEQLDTRLARAAIESLHVLKPLADDRRVDVGLGWFTTLELSTDRATTNDVQLGPVVSLKLDKLTLTANPFLEKTFGRNRIDGIALVYGWQAKLQLTKQLAIGVEGFGVVENLGDPPPLSEQEHRIGPVLSAEIELANGLTITPDLGIQIGLTRATPDAAIKLNVGVPIHTPPGAKAD